MSTNIKDTDAYDMVLDGLSYYIQRASSALAREESSPQGDSDLSDWEIDQNRKKLAVLRRLRDKFEDVVNGNLKLEDKILELVKDIV